VPADTSLPAGTGSAISLLSSVVLLLPEEDTPTPQERDAAVGGTFPHAFIGQALAARSY
jgi:hypothetical protein